MTVSKLFLRWSLVAACAPLLLLTGCPGDPATTSAAPGKTASTATAPTLTPAKPQQQTPSTADTAQSSNNSYKVQQLIANAERSYKSGVTNYQNGRLEAARTDFDFAVDMLLTSGIDVKTEPLLSDEIEHLLNAVNALELAALKQGNGFSPPLEEAPLATAEELTFAPNPELVARLNSELNITSDLPLVINDQVAGYINVFSNSESFRRHMAASLQRVGKYRGLIQNVLKEEGVPQDLIYLAVAESGFQPQVVNAGSGAGGMWQFMTYTAPEYGLTRNGYFDYRFDPEKSSRAYARYIKSLYKQFGDWYLAMAAYDWGPGNIQKAVMRTGYADYWELYRRNVMPKETRAYVPQILAAVIMAKNPERYGLNKLVPSPAIIYDTVNVSYAIDLRLVADVTNSSVAELVALNPALLRLRTASDISFDLHIPPGTKDLYTERLKNVPEDKRANWRFHEVKAGESIESLATDLHSHASEIAEANGLSLSDSLAAGDKLVIPIAGPASSTNQQRYVARRGDTLVTIADRFNISTEDLRRWNTLSSRAIKPGRTLNVAEPIRRASYAGRRGNARGRGNPRGSRLSRTSKSSGRSSSRASRSAGATSAHSSKAASHASSSKTSHARASTPSAKTKRRSGR
ncbi:lytic transglycosylase domain-containing protein [Granulicella sibirica]|uniref:Membrane-bound lytic murein transglycosylase D n=1 Tax=Granulicella sibirica TaxID=2479048 RepID=A0A4Q0TB77_9BACT|nr:lytic transglycosylase domain-containing protein [Granulicella sibirica]RXH58911.1 Membrane-bound lytic murein transglycosylase D precursor [Granulicella sibirica]